MFELRRKTIGAYDKGKAGLVLEEQVLLVDAGSGEVYTKAIGSSFFVGQVFPIFSGGDLLMAGRLWRTKRTQEDAAQAAPGHATR